MTVVESLEASLQSFAEGSISYDGRAVCEADVLLQLLGRFKKHPLWAKLLVKPLESENDYEHTIIMLAIASLLDDMGNGVMFYENSNDNRTPDLAVVLGPQRSAGVEVKAPAALRRGEPITIESAAKIITSAMERAGTGGRGQLSHFPSSLLVIGGFHLSVADLDCLENAAQAYLCEAAKAGRHAEILAIDIVSVGCEDEPGTLTGLVHLRVAENPGYKEPA